jgi:hypothetical protein
MALHLIKLCVGCDSVEDLAAWRRQEAKAGRAAICRTRQTPKRAGDCLDGGSLYWVIKGVVLCRQTIVDVRTIGEGSASRCEIELAPEIVTTLPQPRRAFQGWRYLEPKDAPEDLTASNDGEVPVELARRLREAGVW